MNEPAYTHRQILRVITGIMLCILLAAMDQTVVVPAVPAIAAQLGGFDHLAWIVSAYLLTSTSVTPVYGKLSDMYGRRGLLLLALGIFIAASVLCALAQSLPQLIAFRAIQGLGGGGLMAIVQAAIADVVAPRERGRYQGYMASMWAVASVGGPVIGGWFTDHLSWTFVFWINLPLGLAAMWLCDRALRLLPAHGAGGRIDYAGAGLISLVVAALLVVLSWGGRGFAWMSAPVLGLLAAACVLVVVLVRHEQRVADPILAPRLFAGSVFTRGVIVSFLLTAVLLGATVLLPLFFQLARGADASASGLLVMPFLAFNVVGALGGGQASRYLGRTKNLITGGLAATTLGFAAFGAIGAATSSGLVMLAMAVAGIGLGICMPNMLVTVQNAAERSHVGAATGALLFLRSMGGAFGSTLVASLLAGVFAARMAASGYPGVRDLGALRPGGALSGMGTAAELAGRAALAGGLHVAFLACAAASGVAFLVALGLRDLPLRTAAAMPMPAQAAAD